MTRQNALEQDIKQALVGSIKAMIKARLPEVVMKNRKYYGWHILRFDSADNLKMYVVFRHNDGRERTFEIKLREVMK